MAGEFQAYDYNQTALISQGEQEQFVNGMQSQAFVYMIKGRPAFGYADIHIGAGQKVIADSTALLWLDGAVEVGTELRGGCVASCCRTCAGEPFCFNTFVSRSGGDKVALGFSLPGDMLSFGVTPGNGWVLSAGAFVAGTDNLVVSSRLSSCCACCCGDEGFFLTRVNVDSGSMGVFLAGGYGMLERHDIPDGQTLLVSRGLFFAAREDAVFEVGLIGQECCGLLNFGCTGGGIVFRFRGPAVVYTQSRSEAQLYRDFGVYPGPAGKVKTVLEFVLDIALGAAGGAASSGGGS